MQALHGVITCKCGLTWGAKGAWLHGTMLGCMVCKRDGGEGKSILKAPQRA